MTTPAEIQVWALSVEHILAGKYFQLASFVVLIFDHILTFSEEVERIWKRKITGAAVLFLINRYVTILQFIIILDAYHDARWTKQVCNRFVAFEGASTAALIAICELIMILRVYALYNRSLLILVFLMALWVAQTTISSVGLSTGFAVALPTGYIGCIFTGTSKIFPSIWVAPLVTNTAVFLLTLYRTRDYIIQSGNTPTLHVFLRDGFIYFLVIFMANLFATLIYFIAADDLKAIGAPFCQLITSTMISRLVLNLRSTSILAPGEAHPATMAFLTTTGDLRDDVDIYPDRELYNIRANQRRSTRYGGLWF